MKTASSSNIIKVVIIVLFSTLIIGLATSCDSPSSRHANGEKLRANLAYAEAHTVHLYKAVVVCTNAFGNEETSEAFVYSLDEYDAQRTIDIKYGKDVIKSTVISVIVPINTIATARSRD